MRKWRYAILLFLAAVFLLPLIHSLLPGVPPVPGQVQAQEGDDDDGGDDGGDTGSDGRDQDGTPGDGTFAGNSGSGLVFLQLNNRLYRGGKSGIAALTALQAKLGYNPKMYPSGPDAFILNKSSKLSWLYNVRTGSLKAIPHVGSWNGTVAYINGKSVGLKHAYTKSYPLVASAPGRVRTDWSYNRWNSTSFSFLPDGRHLFTHCPGMGQKESLYFIDQIIGQKQTLYYVPSYPGKPQPILVRDAFRKPSFVDGGKAIVYWRMERVTPSKHRVLVIEAVDIATKRVTRLDRFETAGIGTGYNGRKHYIRGVPECYFFTGNPYMLYKKSMQEDDAMWYYADTRSGSLGRLRFPEGWMLVSPIGDRFGSPHILLARVSGGSVQVRTLEVPSLKMVFSATFRPQGTVRYLRPSSIKGDYLP